MSAEPIDIDVLAVSPEAASLLRQIRDAGLPDPDAYPSAVNGGLLDFPEAGVRVTIIDSAPPRFLMTVGREQIENGEAIRWLRRLIERR